MEPPLYSYSHYISTIDVSSAKTPTQSTFWDSQLPRCQQATPTPAFSLAVLLSRLESKTTKENQSTEGTLTILVLRFVLTI